MQTPATPSACNARLYSLPACLVDVGARTIALIMKGLYQATLSLYRLGVHSVIDPLSDLPTCLADLSLRRHKGEKP